MFCMRQAVLRNAKLTPISNTEDDAERGEWRGPLAAKLLACGFKSKTLRNIWLRDELFDANRVSCHSATFITKHSTGRDRKVPIEVT